MTVTTVQIAARMNAKLLEPVEDARHRGLRQPTIASLKPAIELGRLIGYTRSDVIARAAQLTTDPVLFAEWRADVFANRHLLHA